MENFLIRQEALGDYVSTGSFTVRGEHARRKSAQFTLPNTVDWAVKIVQAILGSSPLSEVEIVQNRYRTEFHFYLPKPWCREEVRELFESLGTPSRAALLNLVAGLLQVGVAQERPFVIQVFEGSQCLWWDGQEMHSQAPKALGQARPGESRIAVSHFNEKELKAVDFLQRASTRDRRIAQVNHRIEEKVCLPKRRVKLDGRYLENDFFRHLVERGETPLYGRIWGDAGRLAGKNLAEACHHRLDFPTEQSSSCLEAFFLVMLTKSLDSIRSRDPSEDVHIFSAQSRCIWVLDGVVIGESLFSLPLSKIAICVYASAEALPLDYGGTALREGEEKEARLGAIQSEAKTILESFGERELKVRPHKSYRTSRGIRGAGLLSTLAAGAALTTIVVKPFLLPVYAKLFATSVAGGATTGSLLGFVSGKEEAITYPAVQEALQNCRWAWNAD